MGDDAIWDKAEAALKGGRAREARHGGLAPWPPATGAFYGPKIDFDLTDCPRAQVAVRHHPAGLPDARAVRPRVRRAGREPKHRPVMIHRAIVGSMERMIGILIEHYAGKFPLWLAPVQAKVLPSPTSRIDYALEVLRPAEGRRRPGRGRRAGRQDRRSKIRDATLERVNYMLVVGAARGGVRAG